MIKRKTISKLWLRLILTVMLLVGPASLYAQTPGTLYASTGNIGGTLITVDPSTGAGSLVDSIGAWGPVTEIEFRSDGVLFGATGSGTSNIITIDLLTGNETLVGNHTSGSTNGLEFDGGGNLLGSFFNGVSSTDLVIVDQSTGQFTNTVGPTGVQVISGLALHTNGTLYGVGHSPGGSASNLYTISTTTGSATLVGAVGFNAVGALEFGPNGTLYGGVGANVSSAGALITIDLASGAGTVVGATGFPGISGLSFVPPATSIGNGSEANIADQFYLEQNYPNPFNPITHISFRLPGTSDVKIEVFDILGNRIVTLLDSNKPAGNHTVDFDAASLASGLYLYRIQAGEFVQMKKMVLMK